MKIGAFIRIARPANVLTAISDIIAGLAIAQMLTQTPELQWMPMLWLVLSTMGLYAGGIVFNDVFDLQHDREHRPERVLPAGKISLLEAVVFGASLFVVGIIAAFLVSPLSGGLALLICVLALSYDKYAKHHAFLGPVNMGLCRSMNLLLGMSISLPTLKQFWMIGLVPLIFIGAITLVGQKETNGNNKKSVLKAILLDVSVVGVFVVLILNNYLNVMASLPFLLFWFGLNFWAKTNALVHNHPKNIQRAVKVGVLSLIPLNAIYVAGFSHWYYAVLLLALLPLSVWISKQYAVT